MKRKRKTKYNALSEQNIMENRRIRNKIDSSNIRMHNGITLNSVRREIVSVLTIVSYDKVRGRNKAPQ